MSKEFKMEVLNWLLMIQFELTPIIVQCFVKLHNGHIGDVEQKETSTIPENKCSNLGIFL